MDTRMANYDLANVILAERRHDAQHRRLIAEARAAKRAARRRDRVVERGLWQLEWGSNGFTGKPVTLVNTSTGERMTGRDPGDWDKAMGRAMQSAALESPEVAGAPFVS